MSADKYNHTSIEQKWQEKWEKEGVYEAKDFSSAAKYFLLVEFPYPSGAGLHVGHVRSWGAMDAYARKKRMEGKNVVYPMGWDAFGLPAENYAIKMGVNPVKIVPENIATFKRQCKSLGLSFDWSREIDTTDPKYYKWTQWIFVQLFKNGMAYQDQVKVNWCPYCKTNLADEEVLSDGTHERCGTPIEKRMQKQWLLRITKYADRLLNDLKLVDFSPNIKLQQENWIGKKDGINITYGIDGSNEKITIFTTRPDTNFGATFIALAPENKLVAKITKQDYKKEVEEYIEKAKKKSEEERIAEGREKTGVFTGSYAINSLNGKLLPIWVSDFALESFGTGAVVGVPGHDRRDFEFAQKFDLPVLRVVVGPDGEKGEIKNINQVQEEEGVMINSDFLDGLDIHEATKKIMDYLEEKGVGVRTTTYHMHDWIFSRQHYWGEPIPMIHCPKDGAVPVPEQDLPVELPYVEKYEPTGTGESPLAKVESWVNTICPVCGGKAKRETDTMPNWAGSNWYFIRYTDPKNDHELADSKKIKYWLPVDFYQGGFEHTTLHLLYSRFIYKFLYDIGVVPTSEPYLKRRSHGIVLGSDGRKMSKSFGNVINPDQIVGKFGADTLRTYEMFMGPFENMVAWSEESLEGCYRFLTRLWRLFNENISKEDTPANLLTKLHQTINKVGDDIENLKFNTAVASMMEFLNTWEKEKNLNEEDAKLFIKVLAPFTPHLAEEVWVEILKRPFSVHKQPWPKYESKYLKQEQTTIIIQVGGKTRGTINLKSQNANLKSEVEEIAKGDENIAKWLEGKEIKKVVFVPRKLINFVV